MKIVFLTWIKFISLWLWNVISFNCDACYDVNFIKKPSCILFSESFVFPAVSFTIYCFFVCLFVASIVERVSILNVTQSNRIKCNRNGLERFFVPPRHRNRTICVTFVICKRIQVQAFVQESKCLYKIFCCHIMSYVKWSIYLIFKKNNYSVMPIYDSIKRAHFRFMQRKWLEVRKKAPRRRKRRTKRQWN